MASYSLPAQCDVRSKLIASCALFLLCDLVRGCFTRYILQCVSLGLCGLRLSFWFMPPPFTCLSFYALMPLLLLVLEP
ncbi:hypothetical protein V1519DRAFT_443753 [Lipomyces tetrasporus]